MKDYVKMVDPNPNAPLEYLRWKEKQSRRAKRVAKIDRAVKALAGNSVVDLLGIISFFVCAWILMAVL